MEMSEEQREERIARLRAELEKLPYDEREALVATLSEEDRAAAMEAELEIEQEEPIPDDEELGTGD
jgi:hypothetical protein